MTHKTPQGALRLSFEYFPPHNDIGAEKLWQAVTKHSRFAPEFVSVTYGAGGSTQDRTLKLLERMTKKTPLNLAGHLTCAGASRDEVLAVAHAYRNMGVNDIVALRGDGQNGAFTPHPQGFASSVELIGALKALDFNVTVGAYPEPHPDSQSSQADIDHFKAKFDAGADRAITQFFFEKDVFLRFRDQAVRSGVNAPIIPGILPIENFAKLQNFALKCGASIPNWLKNAFSNVQSPEEAHLLSVSVACDLISNLRAEGVEDFHLYTLNNPNLCEDICLAMGLEPVAPSIMEVA